MRRANERARSITEIDMAIEELAAEWFDQVLDEDGRQLACDMIEQRQVAFTEVDRVLLKLDGYDVVKCSPFKLVERTAIDDRRVRFKDETVAFLEKRCAERRAADDCSPLTTACPLVPLTVGSGDMFPPTTRWQA
jgi:hypothetical protein